MCSLVDDSTDSHKFDFAGKQLIVATAAAFERQLTLIATQQAQIQTLLQVAQSLKKTNEDKDIEVAKLHGKELLEISASSKLRPKRGRKA